MAIFQYGVPMTSDDTFDPTEGLDINLASTGGTSGSASAAANARTNRLNYQLNLAKAQADAAAKAREAALKQAGAQASFDFIKGQLGAGVPTAISGNIDAQETAQRNFINTTATNLLNQLAGRRDTAQGIQDTGYSNLTNYLARNQPQAFQQAQAASPVITQNALAQYMQAQGASPQAVSPELNRVNALAAGGADNYNQLLNVLRGAEQAGAGSRATEAQLANTLANAQLQAIYGAGTANVEREQLSALNQLAQVVANARLKAQQDAAARDQALQDALAKILGTGFITPPGSGTGDGTDETVPPVVVPPPPQVSSPVAQLAAKLANVKNEALATRIENFVEANPNATKAQIAKVFPSLAKSITATPRAGSSGPAVGFE